MKPILFSTPMVQAILDGRKTMTRRVVKPQPTYITTSGRWKWPIPKSKVHQGCCTDVCTASREWWEYLMPDQMLYNPGDILWVRETWADLRGMGFGNDPQTGKPWNYAFRTDTKPGSDGDRARIDYGVKWRPSIFMPREAARIFLRVTDVRVERLQDISTSDCEEEGLISDIDRFNGQMEPHHDWIVGEFENLWNSINAKRGCGWDTSPWVWVISFERCEKPECL